MATETLWNVWECTQSPTRNRCFCSLSPNWQHRNHNAISSSCPATGQLFWAGHHIRGNLGKTKAPKTKTATVRSKKLCKQCWTYSDVWVKPMWVWDRVFSNCLQKMALTPDNEVPSPQTIQVYVNTTFAWDNIDRLEETLSGAGTSHRVNGIAIQARHFGPSVKRWWSLRSTRKNIRRGKCWRDLSGSKKKEFALDPSATGQDLVAGQDSIFPFVTRFKSRRMSSDLCWLLTHLLVTWLQFTRLWCSPSRSTEYAQV